MKASAKRDRPPAKITIEGFLNFVQRAAPLQVNAVGRRSIARQFRVPTYALERIVGIGCCRRLLYVDEGGFLRLLPPSAVVAAQDHEK
jgi:hypothetical protein